MRHLVSLGLAFATIAFSLHASATSGGITGFSGKGPSTCNQASCHAGGTAPTLTITGPDTLAAGAIGDFTMELTTAAAKGSANIAGSDGVKLAAGTNLKENGTELTHTPGGVAPTGGKVTFTFKATAPSSGTKLTLFAAGLGSDGVGTTNDGTGKTTKDVAITGGAPATETPAPAADDKDKPKTTKPADGEEDVRRSDDPFAAADAQAQCGLAPGPGRTGEVTLVALVGLAFLARKRRSATAGASSARSQSSRSS